MKLAVVALAVLLAGCLSFHAGPMPGEPSNDQYAVVEVDGQKVRVHYIDVGQGPPVVLVHGFGSALVVWTEVIKTLSKNHRVIALDLKGFGWTDRPEGDYGPKAQAKLIAALMDKRGIKSAAVVAHSWGCSVALRLALEDPQRVTRLALYSAWAFEEQLPTFALWSRSKPLGELLFSLFYTERPDDWVARAYYDKRYVTYELVEATRAAARRPGASAAALAVTRGQRYAAVQERYKTIAQPTLILWGREDHVSLVGFGKRLAETMPNASLLVFPNTGHFPMVESRTATTAALAQFLADGTSVPSEPEQPTEPDEAEPKKKSSKASS